MKKIYIVRHAKSSWANFDIMDIDRPLNERGHNDAPVMSKICVDRQYIPNLLITSVAKRALQTCEYFKKQFGLPDEKQIVRKNLYHAPEDVYYYECQLLGDEIKSVMMFGHNPGITYLANSVSENYINNVPTCGVLVIESTVDSWSDLDVSNCKLVDFLYPKMNK